MITLTLLHPLQSVPLQNWCFNDTTKIRIGRSSNNEIVLYSAVVSRYHLEIIHNGSNWEVVSLGANGTYVNGKKISKTSVRDGTILRLASSGPKILVRIANTEDPVTPQTAATEKSPSSKKLKNNREHKDTLIN